MTLTAAGEDANLRPVRRQAKIVTLIDWVGRWDRCGHKRRPPRQRASLPGNQSLERFSPARPADFGFQGLRSENAIVPHGRVFVCAEVPVQVVLCGNPWLQLERQYASTAGDFRFARATDFRKTRLRPCTCLLSLGPR